MIYFILLFISFLFTYFIKNYAIKKSLVATVNERSSHTVPTPHGGGIAIALTWFAGLLYLFTCNTIEPSLFYALMCGSVISIVSFCDDIYELSPKVRLIVQAGAAVVGLYFIGGLQSLTFSVFSIENPFLANIFAFLLIVWYINLTNFIDGINGYVGSMFVFLGCSGLILFGDAHFGVLVASVLGFLVWNWNKAKIFMGDVGSTLLGYNIAIFTLYYANQEASNLWVWIILFGVFWFDATLTLIKRKLNHEKLSQAHKKHAYQRLTQAGWSHHKVTNYSIVLHVVLLGIVLMSKWLDIDILFGFIVSLAVLYGAFSFVDSKKKFQ